MDNRKKAKVLQELDGKTRSEQVEIIRGRVQGKKYNKRQFEAITSAFQNDASMLQVIIESLKVLKESTNFVVEKHEKAFHSACSFAEKVMSDQKSTEQERLKAIKLINNCYVMLTVVSIFVIAVIVLGILFILKLVSDKGKSKNS